MENKIIDTSPLINWEAHKCVIRGVLIAAAAKRRKEKQKHFNDLADRILQLEKAHKQSGALDTLNIFIQSRKVML